MLNTDSILLNPLHYFLSLAAVMDRVKASFQILRDEAASASNYDESLKPPILHLATYMQLLDSSCLSAKTFTHLSTTLRRDMFILYAAVPAVALQHCSDILLLIHREKLALKTADHLWESIAISVLSGVLDFLESYSNYKTRTIVGRELYPIFCRLYFPLPPATAEDLNGSILSTAYQVLFETAVSHAENQRKLRDCLMLGGRRLGMTLSHIRNFLALEALLDLFGCLLPSLKVLEGRQKRSEFIKDTFYSDFPNCDQIVHILENIETPDWSITSLKISDALAKADILFPQPFETRLFTYGETQTNIDRLYVDQIGFFANLDRNGEFETLSVPYSSVAHIGIYVSCKEKINMTLRLLHSPSIGDRALDNYDSKIEKYASCQLRVKDMDRLILALGSRGLKSRLNISRSKDIKISTAEAIVELNSSDVKDIKDIPTQSKINNIYDLWQQTNPTSPFLELCLPVQSSIDVVGRTNKRKRSEYPNISRSRSKLHRQSSRNTTYSAQLTRKYGKNVYVVDSRYNTARLGSDDLTSSPELHTNNEKSYMVAGGCAMGAETGEERGLEVEHTAMAFTQCPSKNQKDAEACTGKENRKTVGISIYDDDPSITLAYDPTAFPPMELDFSDYKPETPVSAKNVQLPSFSSSPVGKPLKGKSCRFQFPFASDHCILSRKGQPAFVQSSEAVSVEIPENVHSEIQDSNNETVENISVTPRIVNIVEQINEVLLCKYTQRFSNVRQDISEAQAQILNATTNEIKMMRDARKNKMNSIVNVQHRYGANARKMIHSLDVMKNHTVDISSRIGEVIHTYRNLPVSMYSKPAVSFTSALRL